MKILITTDLYTTKTNGVVTSVKNLTQALTELGHEVRILTLSEGIRSYCEGNVYFVRSVPIGFIYPDVRMPTTYRNKHIRELIEWGPDVIHSQCEFFSFQFAAHIAKHTGAPLVHTYHTLYEQYVPYVVHLEGPGQKAVGHLSRFRLKDVARIIAPTRKVEGVLRGYGIEAPISVIPSGISLEQHRQRLTASERSEMRSQLGIKEDAQVLVNVGRIGNEKKLDEVLAYTAQACKTNDRLRLLIVGDGPARNSLEGLAATLGIRDKVIFTGMVPPNRVHEYYQLGDVFVSASTSETQGLTYVEAEASGLPLLCREDSCLEEVMLPGQNGYLFTDADSFCQGLEQMLTAPDWLTQASTKSRAIAEGFSREHFGAAVEEVYRTVVSCCVHKL